MCRFFVYLGQQPALIADLLTNPVHSLVRQTHKHYLPGAVAITKNLRERNLSLNGDGFGIGWYSGFSIEPCVFTSVAPAWNNRNLARLANHISSTCIFSHIRAATPGSVLSDSNCHPFQFGRILFMHNGSIGYFKELRKVFYSELSDKCFQMIEGTTDSETAGALFVDSLPNQDPFAEHSPHELEKALLATLQRIVRIVHKYAQDNQKEPQPSSLNFAVSDGKTVIATRFRNILKDDPPTLYYSNCAPSKISAPLNELDKAQSSPAIVEESSISKMLHENKTVVISSEPLSYVEADWTLIPPNHIAVITPDVKVEVKSIIMDDMYLYSRCENKIVLDKERPAHFSPVPSASHTIEWNNMYECNRLVHPQHQAN